MSLVGLKSLVKQFSDRGLLDCDKLLIWLATTGTIGQTTMDEIRSGLAREVTARRKQNDKRGEVKQ